jgi:hypothetical protein
MTAKTMAEVIACHRIDVVLYDGEGQEHVCICGDRGRSHPSHIAAALTAAGFGLVADAKGEAWDEGMATGLEDAHATWSPTPNPYRAAAVRGKG